MADKRMFNKKITESDAFLDMPMSTQCLYFHLNMSADDDGFVNSPRQIMRCVGASTDDYNLLVAKSFIIEFDSGIIVIKHWRIHNYIQSDRYKPTVYEEEKAMLGLKSNNAYTLDMAQAIQMVKPKKELTGARQKRADAYKESDLPSSFNNKICNEFIGKPCPICGTPMSYKYTTTRPTIQHNVPISLGGKHEIDNISVICQSCNCSIQNRAETPPYNTEEVKAVWECIGNVSIDKNSIDKTKKDICANAPKFPKAKSKNKFNEMIHTEYDFDEIEKEILK